MIQIIRPKHKGKTTAIVELCYKENLKPYNLTYILVANEQRCNHIMDCSKRMNMKIPYPITVGEYQRSTFKGTFIKNLVIDDAEDCLLEFLGNKFNITGYTITKQKKTKTPTPQETEDDLELCLQNRIKEFWI